MVQSPPILPSSINVIEKYIFDSKITGVTNVSLSTHYGQVEIIAPYDIRRYSQLQSITYSNQSQSVGILLNNLRHAQMGFLRIDDYGYSNLNKQPDTNWGEDILPLKPKVTSRMLFESNIRDRARFDLRMFHKYVPAEPINIPIHVTTEVIDEKRVRQYRKKTLVAQPVEIEQLCKQAGLEQSLIIRFQVEVKLPLHLNLDINGEPIQISRMNLSWPIATPHRSVKLSLQRSLNPPVSYDPEHGVLQWLDIPLQRIEGEEVDTNNLISDWVQLEINDPGGFYQNPKLTGEVVVEVQGLFSGLEMSYVKPIGSNEIKKPKYDTRTILINKFTLDLEEAIANRTSSPAQCLQFPGVVLTESRIANIVMVLKDQGFQVENRDWKVTWTSDNNGTRHCFLKAMRNEGARQLVVFISIRGTVATTTRERRAEGDASYVTTLPRGNTTIYILGQTQRDTKRIVSVINEIQKQLKEQFHHVSSAE